MREQQYLGKRKRMPRAYARCSCQMRELAKHSLRISPNLFIIKSRYRSCTEHRAEFLIWRYLFTVYPFFFVLEIHFIKTHVFFMNNDPSLYPRPVSAGMLNKSVDARTRAAGHLIMSRT